MVGAADPLHQARGTLGRTDIDERSMSPQSIPRSTRTCRPRRAVPRPHRVLDLAALSDVERAVMQGDGEAVVVHAPEILEQHFGLTAGVDKNERGLVALDQFVRRTERVPTRGIRRPKADALSCRAFQQQAPPRRPPRRCRRLSSLPRAAAQGTAPAIPAWPRSPTGRSRHLGASRHSRARPSNRRSPRFEVTSACSSSSTMRLSDEKRNGASSETTTAPVAPGVVSRMSGG